MGKITKAFSTGISTRRRMELKVAVLLVSHDFFKMCYEFENIMLCTDNWCEDVIESCHLIGTCIESTASDMNFSKCDREMSYIRNRIRKYLFPVLELLIDAMIRRHKSTFTHNWGNRSINYNSYCNVERTIKKFKENSIIRFNVVI
jgi:hypothetical protein